jgi:hypothetical protein
MMLRIRRAGGGASLTQANATRESAASQRNAHGRRNVMPGATSAQCTAA